MHKAQVWHRQESPYVVGHEHNTSSQQDGFENCVIDYSANPFSRLNSDRSRQYIDDMTSSSGQCSGLSENQDGFPMVEQVDEKP